MFAFDAEGVKLLARLLTVSVEETLRLPATWRLAPMELEAFEIKPP